MDKLRVCGKTVSKGSMLILKLLFRRNGVFIFGWYNVFTLKSGS